MYFRLNPECYFIRGVKKGIIYDVIQKKIYSLDSNETELLSFSESNNSINNNALFYELKLNCLGNFYNEKPFIQKIRSGSLIELIDEEAPLNINRAFVEINNKCDNDCYYCGQYGINRVFGCIGCNIWSENDTPMNLDMIKEVIDELYFIGCPEIYLKGGDLTLDWKKTKMVVNYTIGKFDKIFITLQYNKINKDIINFLSDKAIIIAQINLKNNELVYDINNKNMTYLVIHDFNNLNYTIIDYDNVIEEFVLDENFLNNNVLFKKNYSPIRIESFLHNLEYHPCMGNTISITYSGNLIICPMMRHHNFGNINDKKLNVLLKDKMWDIDRFWKLNLDEIKKCSSCEFRYLCSDCRAIEEKITGELNGKFLCDYDNLEE